MTRGELMSNWQVAAPAAGGGLGAAWMGYAHVIGPVLTFTLILVMLLLPVLYKVLDHRQERWLLSEDRRVERQNTSRRGVPLPDRSAPAGPTGRPGRRRPGAP